MNSIMVQLIQVSMIISIWDYALYSDKFAITPSTGTDMMISRFIGSMMMHINCEKDVRNGINMMKYSINHYKQFNNVYPAFFIGLMQVIISLIVEINVMIILSSMPNVLGVVCKYVSLAAIGNIPRFYYNSLVEHRMSDVKNLSLKITNFRHMDPLKDAPYQIKILRIIYKFWKLIFSSWSFYFMPFTAIFLNFNFMVGVKN